uniref:TnsA endonuclease N-terminal domain-containing protein n=1 Tax=Hydrogenovibrio crunogenus (strain DSM 25203 / XCL-2) TaxID=317025 RepID=Q31IP9_HYDCU
MYSPARKIKKSSVKNIVRFPSSKNNRTLLLESILESQFALLLEYDNSVEAYFEQPETFVLQTETNTKHKYTPDFLIAFKNGQRKYIEVKPRSEIESGKFSTVFELFKQKTTQLGDNFEVLSEEVIQREPLLQNLKYFYRFRKHKTINIKLFEELSNHITTPITFKELSLSYDLKSLYQLIAFGYIKFDINNEPFSVNSEVWFSEE